MPVTRDDLVRAVEELRPRGVGQQLVSTAEIEGWFDGHNLDWGINENGRGGRHFEAAANDEPKHRNRLLKFKEGLASKAPVYFALSPVFATEARTVAHGHEWFEVLWDGERWDWQNARRA